MGGAHSHGDNERVQVDTARGPRIILLVGLVLAGIGTIVGLVALWPSGDQPSVDYAAGGVTFPEATVLKVHEPCPVVFVDPLTPPGQTPEFPELCDHVDVDLGTDGGKQTVRVPPHVAQSGLEKGDTVKLIDIPAEGDRPESFAYFGTDRNIPIALMSVLSRWWW